MTAPFAALVVDTLSPRPGQLELILSAVPSSEYLPPEEGRLLIKNAPPALAGVIVGTRLLVTQNSVLIAGKLWAVRTGKIAVVLVSK